MSPTLSSARQFWQARTAGRPPLGAGLILSEFFNPKRVKVGQWFVRLWWHGQEMAPTIRLQVAAVHKDNSGTAIQFRDDEGISMTVCPSILKQDFRRICGENRQALTGPALPEAPTDRSPKKKYWYEEN